MSTFCYTFFDFYFDGTNGFGVAPNVRKARANMRRNEMVKGRNG